MIIEFLGHAGFCIQAGGLQILVDPWLTPSTFEEPVLKCMVPSHKTIDYLIPEPVRKKEDLAPDVILLSHYHTHHASKADIDFWLGRSQKPIVILGYDLHPKIKDEYVKSFSEKYPQHHFLFTNRDSDFNFGEVSVRALTYTSGFHLAFFIKHNGVSFLHLADAMINRFAYDRRLDPLWHKFAQLKPTYFALSVGTISIRNWQSKSKAPIIVENSFLSPVEAANLTKVIGPKMVSVIGVFNFSVWKNRTEYGFPAMENEAYFRWAVQHLDSKIDVTPLRPGMTLKFNSDESYSLNMRPTIELKKELSET